MKTTMNHKKNHSKIHGPWAVRSGGDQSHDGSHQSYGRPELGDKSPYEMFEFYYGKEILDLLGIHKIPANEIILKPELLKHK